MDCSMPVMDGYDDILILLLLLILLLRGLKKRKNVKHVKLFNLYRIIEILSGWIFTCNEKCFLDLINSYFQ